MHPRLQAGIDVALQSLRSHAKIDEKATLLRPAEGRNVLGWDELPLACGCQATTVRAVVDSALQTVHTGCTAGCGRLRRAFRSPAVGLLQLPACYGVTLGSSCLQPRASYSYSEWDSQLNQGAVGPPYGARRGGLGCAVGWLRSTIIDQRRRQGAALG